MSGHEHFDISGDSRTITAWSGRTLQFQPKGWQLEFRSELRKRLAIMSVDAFLFAQLQMRSGEIPADLENVLLYNVGAGCFPARDLTQISLDRLDVRAQELGRWNVKCTYSVLPLADGWQTTQSVATWSRIPVPAAGRLDPGPYWAAMRKAGMAGSIQTQPALGREQLGIDLNLHGPWPPRLLNLIKPVIDGVMCAFGDHRGVDKRAIGALADRSGVDEAEIVKLIRPTTADEIFSSRPTVRLRKSRGVIFDAPDGALVHITLRRIHPKGPCAISGGVYTVAPAPATPIAVLRSDEEEDFPDPGRDPANPCPMCRSVPLASGDGFGRYCDECGWNWMIGERGGYYSDL